MRFVGNVYILSLSVRVELLLPEQFWWMPSVPSPPLCQSRGTLPENMGKGGMRFKRESFPWVDLDLQNLSHKTTLESPNPGPLRLQQTLESPEALKNTDSWALLFWGPTSEAPGSAVLYAFYMLPRVPVRGTEVWKNWQSHLLEDLYNFQKIHLNLDNCLLSPKLIK